jgi:CRISPR/Cas system CSM-associated protein Csm3 (group 7 of RAMP superfamily)
MTFESPFHIGTGMSRGLIDRGVARDAGGYLYIPGATIKGILREKCEQLAVSALFHNEEAEPSIPSPHLEHVREFANMPTLVERIFGSRFRPGTVFFDNATMATETSEQIVPFKQHQVEVRTRTSISRQRGTVQEQALFRSEYGIRDLAFRGTIAGTVEGSALTKNICAPVVLLAAGLRLFDRIGANKSVGMGKFAFQVVDDAMKVGAVYKTLDELIELL